MRVREHLFYRTFVLDLFLRLHFMSDGTADTIAYGTEQASAVTQDDEISARTNANPNPSLSA
jgi:hypothetical protein